MNAQVYSILMIIAFSLSAVFMGVAIFLFFKLKIKSAMDELSGKKSRRQVAEIRKENASSQSRGYVPGIFKDRNDRTSSSLRSEGTGRTTSSLRSEGTGRIKRATSQLEDNKPKKTIDDILDEAGGTVVLNEALESGNEEETTLLNAIQEDEVGTTVLNQDEEGTTILELDGGETTLLVENDGSFKASIDNKCKVIREFVVLESEDYLVVS